MSSRGNFPQWSQWNQWGNAPFAPCHGTLPRMNSAASHSPRNRRNAHPPPAIYRKLDERLAAGERSRPPVKWHRCPARCRRHPSAPSRWLSAATPPELMRKTTHPAGVAALARFQPDQGKSRQSRCKKWSRFTQRPRPEVDAKQGAPGEEAAADLRCLKPP